MPENPPNPSILPASLLEYLYSHEAEPAGGAPHILYDITVFSLDSFTSSIRFDQIFLNVGKEEDRVVRAQNICRSLCRTFANPGPRFERVDEVISAWLTFEVFQCRYAYEAAAKLAAQLLTRISKDLHPYGESADFTTASALTAEHSESQATVADLKSLKVCDYFDVNTICIALVVALHKHGKRQTSWCGLTVSNYIDLLARLLRAALEMVPDKNFCTAEHLTVLREFLWISWQRCVMLLRWSLLTVGGRRVWAETINQRVTEVHHLRNSLVSPALFRYESQAVPDSMCPWAFTHLRSHPAAAGINFDYFLSRYGDCFGSKEARCVPNFDGSYRQCVGGGPFDCARFTGAVIQDQSAHRLTCEGDCPRLFWDEESYRMVEGACAVDIARTDNFHIRYKAFSYATMAVSHVWGHGQGGRPELPTEELDSTGFNVCLHQRYSEIARRMECDSYWMDTACIPQDHQLRREAIGQINEIFATSCVTLVCDLDLMEIDITERSFPVLESVLVAFLVCDWSLRAWTLLEGVKGAQNIFLLCKNDEVVCLAEIISLIHARGRLSLANLCLTIHHLLSASTSSREKFGVSGWGDRSHNQSTEGAATMLKHRHASRDGDDIVIWSLLCGKLAYGAEEFWRGKTDVRTGFLFSSSPRVRNVDGLSWAPSRPNIAMRYSLDATEQKISDMLAEGTETSNGTIRSDGLIADWRVFKVEHVTVFAMICRIFRAFVEFIGWLAVVPVFPKIKSREMLLDLSYHWQMMWLSRKVRQRMTAIALDVQISPSDVALLRPSRDDRLYSWDLKADGTTLAVIELTGADSGVWKKVLHLSADDDIFAAPFSTRRLIIG